MDKFDVFILIIIVVIISIMVYFIFNIIKRKYIHGGVSKQVLQHRLVNQDTHIVVDGLNLVYFYNKRKNKKIHNTTDIIPHISELFKWLVPILQKTHKDRIMFVYKNKPGTQYTDKQKLQYKKLASKYKVYIYLCQDIKSTTVKSKYKHSHASLGRDDFYAAVLAKRYKCRVLSYDKYKDFEDFVHEIPDFQVYQFYPSIQEPLRLVYIRANDYVKDINKPYTYKVEQLMTTV